jgi:hypothetical protein
MSYYLGYANKKTDAMFWINNGQWTWKVEYLKKRRSKIVTKRWCKSMAYAHKVSKWWSGIYDNQHVNFHTNDDQVQKEPE